MLVCGLWLTAAAEDPAPPVWREDFEQPLSGWSQRGRARTPDAVFQTVAEAAADNGFALSLTADRGTGTIGRNLPRVDLRRTPILRWRWRALQAPAGADGDAS